ncbi:tail protein [Mannheimia granulomatis]|uniref:Tail protein n=1 Tax=Mannheimia granulomatis TaxID=85402 RepID=A0A011NBB1_9PAST|nr:tail protein X [Mannheimia granulomatis]EXI61680.1 tail protein [Mannheimia granulomatis]RGE48265.1 tail protein [Mannheimia granulomatis]
MILIARQDDTLDELIYRHYGQTAGLVELALEYNPKLAVMPRLAMGEVVTMPDIDNSHATISQATVQLWD